MGNQKIEFSKSESTCNCITITECKEVNELALAKKWKQIKDDYTQCGFNRKIPKYCCPSEKVSPDPPDYFEYSFDYEETDECQKYFVGARLDFGGGFTITQKEKDEHLTYECVEKSLCNDNNDANGINPHTDGGKLTTLINAAQGATCPEEGFKCCQKLYVKKESCKVRDQATKRLVECEFPFKFKGETHNGCIDYIDVKNGQKIPGKPWCSTKVRGSNRVHVSGGGHYGDCNSSCPGGSSTNEPTNTVETTPFTTESTITTNKVPLSLLINLFGGRVGPV